LVSFFWNPRMGSLRVATPSAWGSSPARRDFFLKKLNLSSRLLQSLLVGVSDWVWPSDAFCGSRPAFSKLKSSWPFRETLQRERHANDLFSSRAPASRLARDVSAVGLSRVFSAFEFHLPWAYPAMVIGLARFVTCFTGRFADDFGTIRTVHTGHSRSCRVDSSTHRTERSGTDSNCRKIVVHRT
jgi:hypothetical protein